MSFKRKRDEENDTDDDEPSFGRQILPVANLPEDFDGAPVDGLQYLFTVRCVTYPSLAILCHQLSSIDEMLATFHT